MKGKSARKWIWSKIYMYPHVVFRIDRWYFSNITTRHKCRWYSVHVDRIITWRPTNRAEKRNRSRSPYPLPFFSFISHIPCIFDHSLPSPFTPNQPYPYRHQPILHSTNSFLALASPDTFKEGTTCHAVRWTLMYQGRRDTCIERVVQRRSEVA